LNEIARAASVEIGQIDAALARLEQGRYGLCERCGKPIEAGRLAAVPQSTTCRQCSS
jgi:RNA polymerase-binding transcription factor DksA